MERGLLHCQASLSWDEKDKTLVKGGSPLTTWVMSWLLLPGWVVTHMGVEVMRDHVVEHL